MRKHVEVPHLPAWKNECRISTACFLTACFPSWVLQELRKQTSKCPICRNHVESLLHIKMHGKKPPPASQAAGGAPAAASV